MAGGGAGHGGFRGLFWREGGAESEDTQTGLRVGWARPEEQREQPAAALAAETFFF
jgi:hypothetical protein